MFHFTFDKFCANISLILLHRLSSGHIAGENTGHKLPGIEVGKEKRVKISCHISSLPNLMDGIAHSAGITEREQIQGGT